MVEILISSAWKSALLLGFAWLLTLALGRGRAAARHCVWTLAVVGTLLFPLLEGFLPRWGSDAIIITVAVGPATTLGAAIPAGSAWNWLLWIWSLGALAVAIRALAAELTVWRMVRDARPAPAALGGIAGVEILESPTTTFPFTWGWLHPRIVLPQAARDWPDGRLEMVLSHELAHAERRDCLLLLPVRLASIVYWFHPLVWWAAGRIIRERERACDDRVLIAGAGATDFAGHLLAVARDAGGLGWAAAHAAHTSQLEGRLVAILNPKLNRKRAGRRFVAAMAAVMVLVAAPLASLAAPEGKVYRVGDGVKPPKLIHKTEPQYTEEAKNAKVNGTVWLKVVIGTDGIPRDIQVTRSLDPGLDKKAVEAVEQWRFEPGTRHGKPVRIQASIEVNFRLN